MNYNQQQPPQQPPHNYNQQQQQWNFPPSQPPVPNATAVLVLGIASIPTCFCYGVVGLILAIIALYLAGSGKKMYIANPGYYSENSYKNLNAGKVCAIVGLCLSALYLLYIVFVLLLYGSIFAAQMDMMRHF